MKEVAATVLLLIISEPSDAGWHAPQFTNALRQHSAEHHFTDRPRLAVPFRVVAIGRVVMSTRVLDTIELRNSV